MRYKIWIDRGGTFTDCVLFDTLTAELKVDKLLSSDNSVLDGIRSLLDIAPDAPIPPCEVRLGTTIATNALLERKGEPCLLVVTRGFADVLEIGTQARPDLFALDIEKPLPLYARVLEVDLRAEPDGRLSGEIDALRLLEFLREVRASGVRSVAVVLLHAHKNGAGERALGKLAIEAGFEHIALSHEVAAEIGLLARGDTATVDAYLTPLLRRYLRSVSTALPESTLRVMQSSGGLTSAERLRGPHAILSGPAGGVVAFSRIAREAGYQEVIGFDMGGTSTDVSRFAGEFERRYENQVAGVRLKAPMLAIHSVASGGGSLCRYDGSQFSVGPESAGANPGPLCYGNPAADELSVTDINLMLGRLVVDRFPFTLDTQRPAQALAKLVSRLGAAGHITDEAGVAEGFFEIANLKMAEAIRQVSIARGYDVRDHALFVFGGAGGQHACAIARALGMRAVLFHRLSGVLSAYGMGLADVSVHAEADAGARVMSAAALETLDPELCALESRAHAELSAEGFSEANSSVERLLDLRYQGTETRLTLPWGTYEGLRQRFDERHAREFGYARANHPVEIVELRVLVTAQGKSLPLELGEGAEPASPPLRARKARLFFEGRWLDEVPVYLREDLLTGHVLAGPALVLERTGTIVLEPGFVLSVRGDLLVATPADAGVESKGRSARRERTQTSQADPVLLEVMNHQYMSIAEQMGHVLQRTALSTNIRERLDFSCAVFDREARLIANAPHIPVHLGAMGESVLAVARAHPNMRAGDAFITNDPQSGGSHLPDVTVVTPVHDAHTGELSFFVASRGHHADIGGISPGSMPAHSKSLQEEGVVIEATRVVRGGVFQRGALLARLTQGRYPARDPLTNLADIEAQLAANQLGVLRLGALVDSYGLATVASYMDHVRRYAELKVRQAILRLGSGRYSFADQLDAGGTIRVSIDVEADGMHIDFSGTDRELESNLNAPKAVTVAAVMYFLRTLVDVPIPLNAGCLVPVRLTIPEGSLLCPSPGAAVVGGNVETSQRVVDVLFGAVGKAAASQGTMNNLSFGNERFGYYETIAGGAGAGPGFAGASGVHTHMTNTRITDAEVLENHYPVRVVEFSRRRGSGGKGAYPGGDGLIRELEFLEPVEISLLTERRALRPFGLAGGEPGAAGHNWVNGVAVGGAAQLTLAPGDRLRLETPGGGGYGSPT